jgi:hypothetical protein
VLPETVQTEGVLDENAIVRPEVDEAERVTGDPTVAVVAGLKLMVCAAAVGAVELPPHAASSVETASTEAAMLRWE